MKQLLLILLLTFVLSEIMSFSGTVKDNKPIMSKFNKTEAIISVGTPANLIADSILIHQLFLESGSQQYKIDSNGIKVILVSKKGARGIAQFLPSTWKGLIKNHVIPEYFEIDNEEHQIAAQRLYMNYLARLNYGIDYDKTRLAIASYNAGYGRVCNLIKKYNLDWEQYLPKQTKKCLKLLIG